MNLARWRDSEMARREERDGEMDFFTKREREKEKKEIKWRMENEFSEMARWRDGFFLQRGKEKKSLIQTMLSKQIVQLYLLHYKE